MEWISVKDRLPMVWQEVIITGEYWGWRKTFGFMDMIDGKKAWFDSWNQINQDVHWKDKISHWMPAPLFPKHDYITPPKEEDVDE